MILPDPSGATTGIPVYMSPRVEQIFGYPADDWLEIGFFESVLHEEDRDLRARPLADQISAGDDRWSIEFRVVAADGRIVGSATTPGSCGTRTASPRTSRAS